MPKPETTIQRALVYHTGAVGDFITILPTIRLWREHNPDAQIVFLGRSATGRLGLRAGYVDELWDVDRACYVELFAGKITPALRARMGAVNTAILFAEPEAPIVKAFQDSDISRIYYQAPFPVVRMHIVRYHLSLLQGVYDFSASIHPVIRPKPGGNHTLGPLDCIVLHHGSGSRHKNWPALNFAQLADLLRESAGPLLWIQGPADAPPPAKAADRILKTEDLWDCVLLLARSRLYVGNDSGLTHLAAAAGCPTIALFGASDPDIWRPLGPNVAVITGDQATDSACAPCHPNAATVKDCKSACMSAISVQKVFQQCLDMLPARLRDDH